MELYDLKQIINKPTRITANSTTLIDHIYTSHKSHIAESFVPNICISDHYPICITRSTPKTLVKRNTHITIRYRSYKTFQESIFLSDLSDKLANLEYTQNDSDQNFQN